MIKDRRVSYIDSTAEERKVWLQSRRPPLEVMRRVLKATGRLYKSQFSWVTLRTEPGLSLRYLSYEKVTHQDLKPLLDEGSAVRIKYRGQWFYIDATREDLVAEVLAEEEHRNQLPDFWERFLLPGTLTTSGYCVHIDMTPEEASEFLEQIRDGLGG